MRRKEQIVNQQNYNWWNEVKDKDFLQKTNKEILEKIIKKYESREKRRDKGKYVKTKKMIKNILSNLCEAENNNEYYTEILAFYVVIFEQLKKYSRLVLGLFYDFDKQLDVEDKR